MLGGLNLLLLDPKHAIFQYFQVNSYCSCSPVLDGLGVNQLLELLLLSDKEVILMGVSLGRDGVVSWTEILLRLRHLGSYRGQHSVHQQQEQGSWRGQWQPGWPGGRRSGQGWCSGWGQWAHLWQDPMTMSLHTMTIY